MSHNNEGKIHTRGKQSQRSIRPVNHTKHGRQLLLFLAIVIIVSTVILLLQKPQDETFPASTPLAQRAIGPETAPVTITEYADFGCITCKAWHQTGIREQVIDQYDDQIRFVWRDFPVTTNFSPIAAEAGFCAADQDSFWAYHGILFTNAPALAPENLKAYAGMIGLNTDEFNHCLDSGKHQQAVENELAHAKELGLRGVPSFVVNGKRLLGPPSFEQLAATIDEILSSQE